MKKWIMLIVATLALSGTAMANCGGCEGAEKVKDKAACEIKGAEKKAACEMKGAEKKAACEMKKAKKQAACEMKKADCEKKGSNWNPINWFK